MPSAVTFVEPEGKLIDITTKMFRTSVVIDANQAAFHDRKNRLDAICGHAVPAIFILTVVHALLREEQTTHIAIDGRVISMQRRTDFDVLHNGILYGLGIHAWQGYCLDAPATLSHSQYGSLADCAASSLEFLVFVLVGFDATYVGFINLNGALKLRQ